MSVTTNFGWTLPDWEISSGQNTALQAIDAALGSLSGVSLDVTYAQLVSKIQTNQLTPTCFYRITDFATVWDQPDYDSLGVAKIPSLIVTKTAAVEPLIVLAVGTNQLSHQAWSTLVGEDYIEYDYTYSVTEYKGSPAKGRISYRRDHWGNCVSYDSRGVTFKRYETSPGSGVFTLIPDNGGAFRTNIPTFGDECENIVLTRHTTDEIGMDDPLFFTSNNIFGDNCESLTAGGDFFNNTFGDIIYGNSFGHFCHDNYFVSTCYNNHIANEFSNNVIQAEFSNNVVGNGFSNNTLGAAFTQNFIGTGFKYNQTLGTFYSNDIQDDFQHNTNLGTNFNNNHVRDYFQYNVSIGADFNRNEIADHFMNNTNIGPNFQLNHIDCLVNAIDFSSPACTPMYRGINTRTLKGYNQTTDSMDTMIYMGYYNTGVTNHGWVYTGIGVGA